jgi:glycosyltransferase 2 family protein
MNRKRLLIYGVVLTALVALVYLQFRQWRNFDWHQFFEDARYINWIDVVHAVILVFIVYLLRAVRWKLFLGPERKDISTLNLLSPTVVGFTALALLGRAGEIIRPYLIARRASTSLSSQLAVWTVERIFDIAAFTVLMVSAIFLPTSLRDFAMQRPEVFHWLHLTGYVLTGLVFALFLVALLINYRGPAIADWMENRFAHSAGKLAHRIAQRIREFAAGLKTIHGPLSFSMISAVSLLMWWIIAVSYKEITHAYGPAMHDMTSSKVLLLMGSSMVGSMVQLPGVGGGSQLATIEALDKIFRVPREMAVSCGILIWLVTFVAIVPVGLALARHEGLSLMKISEESEKEESEAAIPTQ